MAAGRKPVKRTAGKKPSISTRNLDAETMIAITEKMHNKTGLGRAKRSKTIEPRMERLRKLGEYLIKRKFRSSPEEKFVVGVMYKKGIKFSEKSIIIFDYFLKKTGSKKKAKEQALALLDSIEKKVGPLNKAYEESVQKIHPTNFKSGAEHMFSTQPILFGIDTIRRDIKKMN